MKVAKKGMIRVNKINVKLTSGNTITKPLISAFKANSNEYVILDNEMNGTMGLPIILVSKYVNNTLSKIIDQNEWGIVKEVLRNIISGSQVEYINIPENILGDDIFFSQLTLPVASFDTLKNNYNNNILTINPEEAKPIDVTPSVAVAPQEPKPVEVAPFVQPQVKETVETNVTLEEQTPSDTPTMPLNTPPVVDEEISPVVSTTPEIKPLADNVKPPVDYSGEKEAFLKACENMFDALVSKFNK